MVVLVLGKSRYYFKPNILSANGSIIVTDPKGELLRDCGYSLKNKGYTIKVLNLDEKSNSNHYNPLMYIKEIKNFDDVLHKDINSHAIQEDDVMTLINTLMLNTKVETIDNTSGDPFWNKAEMIYLQALFYYTLRHYDKRHQNFTTILKLIRLSSPDNTGVSALDRLFDEWAKNEPNAIGVKQYKHFKVAASAPKMMSTIIMVATARLAAFNIKEIANLTDTDDMELSRIGMPMDDNSHLLKEIRNKTGKNIGNGKYLLDLHRANYYNLTGAGILPEHINVTDICTCCNPDFLFSHRASHGKRGNLGAVIMLKSTADGGNVNE